MALPTSSPACGAEEVRLQVGEGRGAQHVAGPGREQVLSGVWESGVFSLPLMYFC